MFGAAALDMNLCIDVTQNHMLAYTHVFVAHCYDNAIQQKPLSRA